MDLFTSLPIFFYVYYYARVARGANMRVLLHPTLLCVDHQGRMCHYKLWCLPIRLYALQTWIVSSNVVDLVNW